MFESQSQSAHGGSKVILVCSQLYMKDRDQRPTRIALFPHRYIFHKHSVEAMRYGSLITAQSGYSHFVGCASDLNLPVN